MPGFDGTGPMGQGPMTGRGLGRCTGFAGGGGFRRGFGLGMGRGFGRGLGRRFGWGAGYGYAPVAPVTPEEEKSLLTNQISALENQLEYLKKRLGEIEG
ncbi:DUF5320 domain-containing protein [Desulfovulcanus sp.]